MGEGTEPSGPLLRVAFQGEPGAFSEEAVLAHFGDRATPLPRREVGNVGDAVLRGEAEYGLLPAENSVAGTVAATFDLLARTELRVVGEVIRPIRHCLLGIPGSSLAEVRTIVSHPVALAQCVRFLAAHPRVRAVASYDTAGAADEVARAGDPSTAAIAGRAAAERYGLDVLAEGLEDRTDNQTRFLAIAPPGGSAPFDGPERRDGQPRKPPRKTLLILETEDRPGALVEVLAAFAARGVNLCHLQSRPGGAPWTYRFFLEIEADPGDPQAAGAIEEARARATSLRVAGSFERSPPPGLDEMPQGGLLHAEAPHAARRR